MLYAPRSVSPASLSNTDNAANTLTIPAGAALANITAGTLLAWAYLTTTANAARSLFGKTVTGGGWSAFKRGVDGTVLRFSAERTSGNCTIDSPTATLVADTWQYIAITWDISASASCRMVVGSLSAAAHDVGATVSVGAGAPNSDAAQTLALLSDVTPGGGWPGSLAAFAVIRRVLLLRELQDAQFRDWKRLGCAGLWYPGRQADTTLDYSGNANHGTITGLTLGARCAGVKRQSLSTRGIAFAMSATPTPWPFRPLFFG